MNILYDVDLQKFNSFRVPAHAKMMIQTYSEDEILEALDKYGKKEEKIVILGGGTNTLLVHPIDGQVWQSLIEGIKIISENESDIVLEIGAGERWHRVVTEAVNHNWSGIENLALIPGMIGGAPINNIAAYGQNFSDVFVSLDAIDLQSGEKISFSKNECEFAYRQSIFKKIPHRYLITKITIKLSKDNNFSTSYYSMGGRYDSIEKELEQAGVSEPSPKDIYQAVINIRTSKLPDIRVTPSVGSFFINPVVDREKLESLERKIQNLQYYPVDDLTYLAPDDPQLLEADFVKVPVGRLLNELGWQDKSIGNCGVYQRWASIVTHNGRATGQELLDFTNLMKEDVYKNYGIKLESEVMII